jgi:hypothetical protein
VVGDLKPIRLHADDHAVFDEDRLAPALRNASPS